MDGIDIRDYSQESLRDATRLVVLDQGRIAEVGTHDELIEKHGIYYGLVMAQREISKMDVDHEA